MINSEEVYDILEEYGVTPVDCGKLSFKEQIDVAASSHLILGIHGASLANCVFSAPGSIMLELAPRNYQPVYFSKLTSACGLGYEQILGAESGPLPFQKPIYNADIIVPTKALRKSLARLTAK
jgi:capsular polysaccharide biosynthesis protein